VPGEPQRKSEPQPAVSAKPRGDQSALETPPPLPEPPKPEPPAAPQEEKWSEQVQPALAILDEDSRQPAPAAPSASSHEANSAPPPLPGGSVEKRQVSSSKDAPKPAVSMPNAKPATPKPDAKPFAAKSDPKPAVSKSDAKPAKLKSDPKPATPRSDPKPAAPKSDAKPAKSKAPQPAPPRPKLFRAEKLQEAVPPPSPPPPAPMAIPDFASVEPSPPSTRRSGRRGRRRDRKRAKPQEKPSPWSTSDEQVQPTPSAAAEPTPSAAAERSPAVAAERSFRTPPRPRRDRGRPKVIPPGVYRPDIGKIATVRGLAIILSLIVAFSIGPAVYAMFSGTGPVPAWSRLVLLVGALQMAYILWMVAAPDWASVWVVMLSFAAVSAVYGMATGVSLAPPLSQPEFLGMSDQVHRSAKFWCAAVTATMALATYLCGRNSARWRRSLELQHAGRNR